MQPRQPGNALTLLTAVMCPKLHPDVLCCCLLLLGCVLLTGPGHRVQQQAPSHDVVLSSGFLAFAQHAGFLQAVEEVSEALPQQCCSSTSKAVSFITCAAS